MLNYFKNLFKSNSKAINNPQIIPIIIPLMKIQITQDHVQLFYPGKKIAVAQS